MSYWFQQNNSLGYQLPDFAKPVTPASYKPDTNYASVVDLYPWLDDRDREAMNTSVQALPIQQQAVEKQKIYEQKVKEKQQQQFMDSRVAAKNELYLRTQQEKDPVQKNNMDKTYKMANIADLARERMDIPAHITDQEIVDRVVSKVPNGDRLFMDYMNNKNDDLMTLLNNAPWGKSKQPTWPQQPEEKWFIQQSAEDIKSRFSSFYDGLKDTSLKDLLPNIMWGNRVLLRGAWALAWSANDVIWNAISSLTKSVWLDKPLWEVVKSITDTEIWQKWLELLQKGWDAFKSFEAVHPKQAQDIKDLWELAQFAPVPAIWYIKPVQEAVQTAWTVVWDALKAPIKWLTKILPTAEDTITRLNRMTKLEIASFTKQQWVQPWKWLNDRWFVTAWEDTLDKLATHLQGNMSSKWEALSQIKQTFTSPELVEMAKDAARYADETLNPSAKRISELYNKSKDWLNWSEAQEVISFYQRNNKFDYGKNITASEKSARATNIDNAVREQMLKFAEDNWLPWLRDINKEIQGTKFILDKLGKNMEWSLGNDYFTLTDYIIWAGTNFDPTAMVVGKVAKSDWFRKSYAKIINKINWHTNIRDKILDIEALKRVQNKKELDNFLALPYKDNIWDIPNNTTIIPDWQKIISWPNGSVREWQILETPFKQAE